jgi:hypothetical protein
MSPRLRADTLEAFEWIASTSWLARGRGGLRFNVSRRQRSWVDRDVGWDDLLAPTRQNVVRGGDESRSGPVPAKRRNVGRLRHATGEASSPTHGNALFSGNLRRIGGRYRVACGARQ